MPSRPPALPSRALSSLPLALARAHSWPEKSGVLAGVARAQKLGSLAGSEPCRILKLLRFRACGNTSLRDPSVESLRPSPPITMRPADASETSDGTEVLTTSQGLPPPPPPTPAQSLSRSDASGSRAYGGRTRAEVVVEIPEGRMSYYPATNRMTAICGNDVHEDCSKTVKLFQFSLLL